MGAYFVLVSLVLYSTIVYCSVCIWLHMRTTVAAGAGRQSRSWELTSQVNMALVAQAVAPILLASIPASLLILDGQLNFTDGNWWKLSAVIFPCLAWGPVVNAVCVLAIIRPYKRMLIGWASTGSVKANNRVQPATEGPDQ